MAMDTSIPKKEDVNKRRDDIHEIMYNEEEMPEPVQEVVEASHSPSKKKSPPAEPQEQEFDFDRIRVRSAHQVRMP